MKVNYLLSIALTGFGFLLSFLPSAYFIFLSREMMIVSRSADPARLASAMADFVVLSYYYPVLNLVGLLLIIGGVYLYVKTGLVPRRP